MAQCTEARIQHNCVDHSNDPAPAFDHYEDLARNGTLTVFPLKLYNMLQRVEEDGHADIVSWQPHGRCFVVHKPEEFKNIVPKYFKLTKVSSFQHQINLYGFKRLCQVGPDHGGYYHSRFLRRKAFLIQKLDRVAVKGIGVRCRSNPDGEPNFWAMNPVGQSQLSPVAVSETGDELDELDLEGLEPLPIDYDLSDSLVFDSLRLLEDEVICTAHGPHKGAYDRKDAYDHSRWNDVHSFEAYIPQRSLSSASAA